MKFKFHKQKTDYTCGAACMRMALEGFGIRKSERQIAKSLGTNKSRGTRHRDFSRFAEKHKFIYFIKKNASISVLKKFLKKGFTVIVCYFYQQENTGHYAVVRKIDSKNIYFWDPAFGPNHKYLLTHFKKIWFSKCDDEKRWFFAVRKA